MKIAYFTDFFFPDISGIITSLANLGSNLAKNNHTVLIAAPVDKNNTYQPPYKTISTEYVPFIPTFFPEMKLTFPNLRLFNRVKTFNPDIIHVESLFILGIAGICISKLLKKPLVGHFHGYINNANIPNLKIINSSYLRYIVFFLNMCDAVISPGVFSVAELKKHGLKKPIHTIPNLINEEKMESVSLDSVSDLKKRFKLKKNVVLFVGRLVKEKNVDILIKSLQIVLNSVPDTSLFIIGTGEKKQELLSLTQELGLKQNVVFADNIDQTALLTEGYYQVADVFATASTIELQPVSFLEAMYFKLPIVGVDERGVTEMIHDTGLISKPGDAEALGKNITKVLSYTKLKKELSDKSFKKYSGDYSPITNFKRYTMLYNTLVTKT